MAAKKRKKLESKIPNSRNKVSRKAAKKKARQKPAPKHELARLNKVYSMQLEEKDKIISRLKKENAVLLATALKQGAKTREIFERAKKAMKKK